MIFLVATRIRANNVDPLELDEPRGQRKRLGPYATSDETRKADIGNGIGDFDRRSMLRLWL